MKFGAFGSISACDSQSIGFKVYSMQPWAAERSLVLVWRDEVPRILN